MVTIWYIYTGIFNSQISEVRLDLYPYQDDLNHLVKKKREKTCLKVSQALVA